MWSYQLLPLTSDVGWFLSAPLSQSQPPALTAPVTANKYKLNHWEDTRNPRKPMKDTVEKTLSELRR